MQPRLFGAQRCVPGIGPQLEPLGERIERFPGAVANGSAQLCLVLLGLVGDPLFEVVMFDLLSARVPSQGTHGYHADDHVLGEARPQRTRNNLLLVKI